MNCIDPIDGDTLLAYWLAELPVARDASVEAHLFTCATCTRRLEGIVALSTGMRTAVGEGRVNVATTPAFIDTLRQAGLRVREYRLGPGDRIDCTIRAEDDIVVSRIRAPLAGVRQLDVVCTIRDDDPGTRLLDVPFDAAAGEVLMVPSAAWLRTMPAFRMHMRLVAHDDTGERPIGEYVFDHTPA